MAESTSVLGLLKDDQIFSIQVSKDKKIAVFYEECDHHYHRKLNKQDISILIDELTALHNEMQYKFS